MQVLQFRGEMKYVAGGRWRLGRGEPKITTSFLPTQTDPTSHNTIRMTRSDLENIKLDA